MIKLLGSVPGVVKKILNQEDSAVAVIVENLEDRDPQMIIDRLNDIILSFIVKAHSWYPAECCKGPPDGDCRAVPCEDVLNVGNTWTYLGKTFKRILPSPDEMCHACFTDYHNYCLFVKVPLW